MTIRPNWQAHLPTNFGSPEHGKLKADQWRTAIEFDIPVSLVFLKYTRQSSGIVEDERFQKLVDHTMDLALATAWGFSRRTSPKHAERYEFYMKRYLTGIKELFPDYDLKPNHHYALHIPEILRSFGPLHGTWAFKTERLIGALQKLNTNSKIGKIKVNFFPWLGAHKIALGEMEQTALSMFCRRANLVRLIDAPWCPAVLKTTWNDIKPSLNIKDLDIGTNETALSLPSRYSSTPMSLDGDIQDALRSFLFSSSSKPDQTMFNASTAFKLSYYKLSKSITYSSFDTSIANSLVYFRVPVSHNSSDTCTTNGDLFPAKIRLIFQHYRKVGQVLQSEIFVALHRFRAAQVEKDPFLAYPDFRARLYHKEPLPIVTVVRVGDIHCHANCRPWDVSLIVMRAIDRVGLFTSDLTFNLFHK